MASEEARHGEGAGLHLLLGGHLLVVRLLPRFAGEPQTALVGAFQVAFQDRPCDLRGHDSPRCGDRFWDPGRWLPRPPTPFSIRVVSRCPRGEVPPRMVATGHISVKLCPVWPC